MLEETFRRMVYSRIMNIAICDDSRFFIKTLERELNHYAALRDTSVNLRVFSNPNRLLVENLSDTQVAFLDIEMPQLNGLELAGQLRQRYPELLIVFLSSFIAYAPAGYRVNAFRYILKKELEQELPQVMDDIAAKLQADGSMIDLPTRDRTLEIAKKDVLYFEGTPQRSVLAYTRMGDSPIVCRGKLADFDLAYSSCGFLRLQKSYLANMDHILKIRNYIAVISNGTELKVSERRYAEVCKTFLMWRSRIL